MAFGELKRSKMRLSSLLSFPLFFVYALFPANCEEQRIDDGKSLCLHILWIIISFQQVSLSQFRKVHFGTLADLARIDETTQLMSDLREHSISVGE